jgi:hypothetical protein
VDNETLFRKATTMGLPVRGNDNWHPNNLGYLLIVRYIYKTMPDINWLRENRLKSFHWK